MKWSLFALLIGFGIDLIVGDPHGLPHPVVGIGKLISLLERRFRAPFPKTARGEIFAGACIWLCTVLVSAGLPALILYGAQRVSVYLRLAGDAWYRGVLHKKPYIGDERRAIEPDDIPRACRLMTAAAILALLACAGVKALCIFLCNR